MSSRWKVSEDGQSGVTGSRPGIHEPAFDGKACYKLRCRVFRSGDARIDDKDQTGRSQRSIGVSVGEFSLDAGTHFMNSRAPEIDSWGFGNKAVDKQMTVNLVGLCLALCEAAIHCYWESEHGEAYDFSRIPLNIRWPDRHASKTTDEWIREFGLVEYE